jgi:hypothetical protein
MKEEDNILNRCGNRRPFAVPEGYFENLTESIMSSLPEKDTKQRTLVMTPWTRFRPIVYAAAAIAGIFFCIEITNEISTGNNGSETVQTESVVYSDEYIDSFLEETMIDDYTFYCSLFDSNNY